MEKRANELFSLYFFRRKQEHSRSCVFYDCVGLFLFFDISRVQHFVQVQFKTFSGWRAAQFSLFFFIVQKARFSPLKIHEWLLIVPDECEMIIWAAAILDDKLFFAIKSEWNRDWQSDFPILL